MTDKNKIENAGLVLAAPFLPHLFRNLGLLAGMRFADEAAQARAVYILQYMADGLPFVTGNLQLNMLLCGWLDNRALPPAPALSEAERRQADQAVEALRSHWTALGDMSLDTLRSQFFRRDARIEMGLEPKIIIRAQPHDAPLKDLPWIIAVTRTPWSEKIHVDWESRETPQR